MHHAGPRALIDLCRGLVKRIYGDRLLSRRTLLRSASISIGSAIVVLLYGLWRFRIIQDLADAQLAGTFQHEPVIVYASLGVMGTLSVFAWALSNLVADFLSLAVTWGLLRWLRSRTTVLRATTALACDTVALVVLGVLPSAVLICPIVAMNQQSWTGVSAGFGYLGGALTFGNETLPVEAQDFLKFAIYSTLLSGCFASVVYGTVLVGALVAVPFQGGLYRWPGRVLIRLGQEHRGLDLPRSGEHLS